MKHKLFKNKFFIIGIASVLAVSLFCGVFSVMGWGNLLHEVGGTIIYPFQWVFSKVGSGIEGFGSYFSNIDELQDEIDALKEENESLKSELIEAGIAESENEILYGYLDMKNEHVDYTLCPATVIAASSSSPLGGEYVTHITLNKGSSHGVKVGMPVLTPVGLVGMVIEVGLDHCRVQTVISTSSSVGGVTAGSGELGIVEGDLSCMYDGYALMKQMDEGADVEVGDIVVSGGNGSVYPYGIPIGRVVDVGMNAYSRTVEARIEPFCDMTDIENVVILTAYDRFADGNRMPEDSTDTVTDGEASS
jgi:rod shape-determining protein MreC